MQWLREGHTIRIGKEVIGYGDDIPVSKISKKVLDKWKERGWVGSVAKPGVISGKDALDQQISELSAANKTIQTERDGLKEKVAGHAKAMDDLKSAQAEKLKGMKADIDKASGLEAKMVEINEARAEELKERDGLFEQITKLKADHSTELETLKASHAEEIKKLKEKKK